MNVECGVWIVEQHSTINTPQSTISDHMPTPALLLVIATLLPLLGFVILLFVGKKMGTPLAGWVGTAMIGGSFVCSLIALMVWMNVSKDSAW